MRNAGQRGNGDDVGEMDCVKKEFDDYWADPIRKHNRLSTSIRECLQTFSNNCIQNAKLFDETCSHHYP
jgi:hypothetical protein